MLRVAAWGKVPDIAQPLSIIAQIVKSRNIATYPPLTEHKLNAS